MHDWEVFDAVRPVLGMKYGANRARMFAFSLAGGGICAVSPGKGLTNQQFEALEKWGRPTFLLAPNHFHSAGIAEWKARYPDVVVVSHANAAARLSRQVPGVRFQELTLLEASLCQGDRIISVPMARQGETWVSLSTSAGRTWFVTDSLVNESRLPRGAMGFFIRAVGFREKLMTNPFFKRFFLTDKPAYKRWVENQLQTDTPDLFVPAHGDVLTGPDVAERLRAATEIA